MRFLYLKVLSDKRQGRGEGIPDHLNLLPWVPWYLCARRVHPCVVVAAPFKESSASTSALRAHPVSLCDILTLIP